MFSHLPPLNQIRGFEAAAQLGSFKAAGEELSLSPTAISHQIANLEDKLGVLLFERKTRSVILTRDGSVLAEAAHQALQKLSTALEEISNTQSVLRVTTTSAFAAMWLVPNLASFQKKYPKIEVEIKTGEDSVDICRDRRIDLAIRYGKHDSESSNIQKIVTESFGAYATEDYLSRYKDLKGATLIETQWQNKNLPSITWSDWLQEFRPEKTVPQIRCFDQEFHAIQAALAGQGMVLASSILAKMAIQQGWLKALDSSCTLPSFSYYLLVSPFSTDLPKVIVFKEWLIEELLTTGVIS